jgi:hypothetical protein
VTVARTAGRTVAREELLMLQKFLKLGATFALVLGVLALSVGLGTGADEKKDPPTISDIMKKGHAKTDGYIDRIKLAAKDGKWEDATEYAKTLAFFGENLGKNKPPKGSEESWKAQTTKYADATKAVLKAVEAKDAKAVNKAFGGISCGGCHKEHK